MVHLRERLSGACLCCLVAVSFSALTSWHQTFVLFVELKALLLDVNPGGYFLRMKHFYPWWCLLISANSLLSHKASWDERTQMGASN